MQVLIVESDFDRAATWAGLLRHQDWRVTHAATAQEAIRLLDHDTFRIIVLNLDLACGEALSVPVYAGYRQPTARVVVVTRSGMFNDGSIFQVCSNACGYLSVQADPADLVALVDHHGNRPPVETPPRQGSRAFF